METTQATATVSTPSPAVAAQPFRIFATCPSSLTSPNHYRERVGDVARWSEQAGCTGLLIYTDNSLVDPWLVAQLVLQSTDTLCPLVAVQPVYLHPYSVAKIVSTLAFLHGRRIFLNMVAGGFKNDLLALHDTTPHDLRYERLLEYTSIIQRLMDGGAVNFRGQFYEVSHLALQPTMPLELHPGILVSGSSPAGLAAARQLGATAVKYPEPPGANEEALPADIPCGVRIGIVARPQEDEAWEIAHQRFPNDRKGQLTRQLATKVTDSNWHYRLAEIGKESGGSSGTYWLHPFDNYQTNCPYLVGSYANVAAELAHYIKQGYRTVILDIPPSEEELHHIGQVFQRAAFKVNS
jgi:alkanesulfonate monooxygenase